MNSKQPASNAYRPESWLNLVGALVEVRKHGETTRTGVVDDVMPDSSALWLIPDDRTGRIIIEAAEDYEIWVEPRELTNGIRFRMVTSALSAICRGRSS